MYDKLITKVNHTDTKTASTGRLVSKTQYDSEKRNIKKKFKDADEKIRNTSILVSKKTNLNTKIRKIENKTHSVTGLVATAVFFQKLQVFTIKTQILVA